VTASQIPSSTTTPTEWSYRSAPGVSPSTPTRSSYRSAPTIASEHLATRTTAESTGVSTYDSISYDVCPSSDLSNLTPLSSSCSDAASTFSDAGSVMELLPSIGSGSDVLLSASEGTTYITARMPMLRSSML